MNRSAAQHPHVAEGVADVSDEQAELVQVTLTDRVEPEFADAAVELFGALVRVLGHVASVAQLAEVPGVLHQARLDVLVIQKPV